MTYSCPLCHSNHIDIVESLSVQDLNHLYLKSLNIKTALKSDHLNYLQCQSCSLGFFDPMETGGEEFYEQLQENDWYYMEEKEEFNIAKKYIDDSCSILEVGAGRAAFTKYVDKERYTGLEFNDQAIKKASQIGVNLIKQSIEEHAKEGNKYDVVVSFQVLEHISSPHSFLEASVECLNPGGKLIIAVPSQDGFLGLETNNLLHLPPHHVTHWSEKTLKKLSDLFDLTFVNIENESIAKYHIKSVKSNIISHSIYDKLGINSQLLDRRISSRIIHKLSAILSYWMPVNLSDKKGHSVVSVYKK